MMRRLLIAALSLSPVFAWAGADQRFGEYVVHCNALSTNQLLPAMAKQYGIERSAKRGLLNVSIESTNSVSHTVNADVTATVGDLTGHDKSFAIRETSENGDVDYIGEFPLDASDTYVFDVKVAVAGQPPFVIKFTQDLVVD